MAIIPCKQLSLADVFQIVRKFMNLTSLSFCHFFNQTLILMKLFLIPSGIISMHQRVDPVNTLYMPFCGHLSSNGFFQSLRILYFLFSLSIPDIFVNSVILIKSLMLLKLPVSNRIFWRTYNQSLITLLMLPNLSARLLILPKQI